jgi:osmotically-inducible protein OsmY
MADRYPNQDYGRESSRGRFSRERWSDDDDWRRGSRRIGSQNEDEEERRGYGAYGGAYGQGMSGNYAGGYDRTRREWDEDFGRGGGYGGSYGQGGMRGQSYGGGGYRSREDYDRDYGLQGSRYGQTAQSFNEPVEQPYPRYGQGGYQQTGQGWGGQSSYGPGGYGSYGPQGYGGSRTEYGQTGTGNWVQGSQGGYSAQGNWGQGGGMTGNFGERYGQGQGYRSTQQGYGGYAGPSSGQSRWGMGMGQESERTTQDFGGYESSFGQGGYLTRGGRQQWGRFSGRGPKGYTRSDDRIREDVNDRLTDDPEIDATEIDVKVSNCEVTLTGTVDSREDKRRAEECAETVSGVKNVQNNLRVQEQRFGEEESTRTVTGKKSKPGGDNEQRMQ